MDKAEVIFTFRNTHQAIKGEQTLLEANLAVRVMALPSALGAGCGLCLRVAPNDRAAGLGFLAAGEIEPEGVYLKSMGGGTAVYSPLGSE